MLHPTTPVRQAQNITTLTQAIAKDATLEHPLLTQNAIQYHLSQIPIEANQDAAALGRLLDALHAWINQHAPSFYLLMDMGDLAYQLFLLEGGDPASCEMRDVSDETGWSVEML